MEEAETRYTRQKELPEQKLRGGKVYLVLKKNSVAQGALYV